MVWPILPAQSHASYTHRGVRHNNFLRETRATMSGIDGQAQLSSATVRIFHGNGNGRHWRWATREQEGNDIFISLPYLFNRIGSTANFSGIQRHSHHGINSQRIEAVDRSEERRVGK